MRRIYSLFDSSIGRKLMVAAAGLLLCGFLVIHLAGNLLLLSGEGPFNQYAKALETNPLLPLAELTLLAIFLVHIVVSSIVTYQNKKARPVGYAVYKSKGGRTAGSSTMAFTGLLLLVFLVIHVKSFRFPSSGESENLYTLVMTAFSNFYYSVFYIAAMAALWLHLSHGFQSAFQTFGVNHPKLTPFIKKAGLLFAAAMAVGFAMLPAWAYMKGVSK